MRPEDLYHVGIVAADFDAGMTRLVSLLGVRWGDVLETQTPVRDPSDGRKELMPMRVAYTIDAPHLELIEEVPGSIWTCNPYSNLHHIGYWSSLQDDSLRLGRSNCPAEVTGWSDGMQAPQIFAYHLDPLGIRIELVDEALRLGMETEWRVRGGNP